MSLKIYVEFLSHISKLMEYACLSWGRKLSNQNISIKFVACVQLNALALMHVFGMTLYLNLDYAGNVHWCLYFLHLLSGRQKIECLLWTLCSKCLIEMLLYCITLTPWDSALVHWDVVRRHEMGFWLFGCSRHLFCSAE